MVESPPWLWLHVVGVSNGEGFGPWTLLIYVGVPPNNGMTPPLILLVTNVHSLIEIDIWKIWLNGGMKAYRAAWEGYDTAELSVTEEVECYAAGS